MNEQALKERLKYIAKAENKTFQEIWKLLILERFLSRLASSKYQDNFVFKGGVLLSYYITINRETTDIDFLARKLQAELLNLEKTLIEICNIDVNDGFKLSFDKMGELDHNHMNYPGYRAKVKVAYGNMKDSIQIDIGVGDAVNAKKITIPQFEYKNEPIFASPIELSAYPLESIFSEKLETIISRGAANSRMKDFHGLYLLCKDSKLINEVKLKTSINTTFKNRNTTVKFPIVFAEIDQLQAYWLGHLRTLDTSLNLPNEISDIIRNINDYLTKIFRQTKTV